MDIAQATSGPSAQVTRPEAHQPGLIPTSLVKLFLGIILVSLLGVLGTQWVFRELQLDLQDQGRNEQSRMLISEEIVRRIVDIEMHVYYLSTTRSSRAYDHVERDVQVDIDAMRQALNVLKSGGRIIRELDLNLVGQSRYQREVAYTPPEAAGAYVMEWIELTPHLDRLDQILTELRALITARESLLEQQDMAGYYQQERRIGVYVKGLQSHFHRMRENANRAFAESSEKLLAIQNEHTQRQRFYTSMEHGLVTAILLLTVLAGGYLVRRIQLANAHLSQTWNELTREQALFKSIAFTMSDGLYVTDAQGNIRFANPAAEQLLGSTASSLMGRRAEDFFQTHASANPASPESEILARPRQGSPYPVHIRHSPMQGPAGEPVGQVSVFSDATQDKAHEAHLYELGHFDPLTGLPNRLLMQDRLEHALTAARNNKQMAGLLLISISNLKLINESFGHEVGDALIIQLAERFKPLSEGGWLGRWSGTEFTLVMEGLQHEHDAEQAAEFIIDLLEQPLRLEQGQEVYLGGRVGISLSPRDGNDAATIMRNADTALHKVKTSHHASYLVYHRELTLEARRSLEMDAAMRHGLERNEFQIYFQPLVHAADDRMVGAEVLVRWFHPDMGLVSPGVFIPVAEHSGFILPLGQWILRAACRQYVAWQHIGLTLQTLAVNLSPRQFRQRDLVQQISDILQETGMPPEHLELELTESAMMDNSANAISIMTELRKLGIRLAIDDFGTGYSSLAYLKQFPIDKLKIDQSFVRGLPDDKDDRAIVSTILAMGHSLELEILAEGVETPEQARYLKHTPCDTLQGYLYSPPVPAQAFEAMFSANTQTNTHPAG